MNASSNGLQLNMGTKNKAVTAYLPEDIEARLTEYCLDHGLSRQGKKSGKEKPALGTGIIEVLKTFFSLETGAAIAPVVDKKQLQKIVSKTLPDNVPTEKWVQSEIKQAIAALKEELTSGETTLQTVENTELEESEEEPETEEKNPKEVAEKATEKLTLNQADLAKRLGSNPSTLGRHQKKGEAHFAEWSKAKDPDQSAWKYSETKDNSKIFIVTN
ncbi:MAG: hypothetical protein WBB82_03300 [Limnothrix sp.]